MKPRKHSPTAPKGDTGPIFDEIAFRYDLLNRLLSLRRDVAWRKRLLEDLPEQGELVALDVATGTGDVLLALLEHRRVKQAIGIDVSPNMLRHAQRKLNGRRVALVRGDAMAIPLPDESVDVVTIAFGIRNVPDMQAAFAEMRRVLRPGGKLLALEFSLPLNPALRRLYLWYFRHALPRIGGLISGRSFAYRYLNRSVEAFPYGKAFCACMRAAGFQDVSHVPLSKGVAALYGGTKAKGPDA